MNDANVDQKQLRIPAGTSRAPALWGAIAASAILLTSACSDEKGYSFTPSNPPADPQIQCPFPDAEDDDVLDRVPADPERIATLPEDAACGVVPRTMSRLTRTEYNNTLRDVLKIESAPADAFPREDATAGFTNNAAALSVAPLLVEKYFEAARQVAAELVDDGQPKPKEFLVEAEAAYGDPAIETYHTMFSTGTRKLYYIVEVAGIYHFTVRAFGEHAGGLAPEMHMLIDDANGEVFDVTATAEAPERYRIDAFLEAGQHTFEIRYRNDYYRQESVPQERAELDRNLVLDYMEISGPFNAAVPELAPAPRRALMTCQPGDTVDGDNVAASAMSDEACAREIFARVGRQLLRRPVSEEKINGWLGFIRLARSEGEPFEHGLELALRAMLLDVEFLFRIEYDEDVTSPRDHLLSDHELAARLSYFLWSSPPDDRLSEIADAGELTDPLVLHTEVRRMLADERARALTQVFAGQWLQTRAVADVGIDAEAFPTFNDSLKQSMACETELVFDEVRSTEGSAADLLRADFTYVNNPLALNYDIVVDIEDENGLTRHRHANFERVELGDSERRGILTHGGILALGAHPERTSPVRRGNWVLKQLLCIPPPPPPPGVEGLPEGNPGEQSLREIMEQHREDPACAGCHVLMDPIGLAFEHFDAIGRYRTSDDGAPIVIQDSLLGEAFETHHQMTDIVADSGFLERCVVQHSLTYAIGRELEPYDDDKCSIDSTVSRIADAGGSLNDVFAEIALSSAFRMRRPMQPGEFNLQPETEVEVAP